MSDAEDIQKTISTYSEAGTKRDWNALVNTFMPDALWELVGTEHKMKGHAELRAGFPTFVADTDYLLQLNAPAVISVTGDKATARSLIRESGKIKGADEWIEILGSYEDVLVKTPQGWRFTHRRFVLFATARSPMSANSALPTKG